MIRTAAIKALPRLAQTFVLASLGRTLPALVPVGSAQPLAAPAPLASPIMPDRLRHETADGVSHLRIAADGAAPAATPSKMPSATALLEARRATDRAISGRISFDNGPTRPSAMASAAATDPESVEESGYLSLEQDAFQRYDEEIDNRSSRWRPGYYDEFYTELYGSADFKDRAKRALIAWSTDFTNVRFKEALTAAWIRATSNQAPRSDLERIVMRLYGMRNERWSKLASRLGIAVPRGFHVYRGVHHQAADAALTRILEAWQRPDEPTMEMPQHGIASWTLSRKKAEFFAVLPPHGNITGILFEADVPLEYTLADQWVDTVGFPHTDEKEVIVGAIDGRLRIPKTGIKVAYKGRLYSYADRRELIDLWNHDHPAAGTGGAASAATPDETRYLHRLMDGHPIEIRSSSPLTAIQKQHIAWTIDHAPVSAYRRVRAIVIKEILAKASKKGEGFIAGFADLATGTLHIARPMLDRLETAQWASDHEASHLAQPQFVTDWSSVGKSPYGRGSLVLRTDGSVDVSRSDFISAYATSNPVEDAAESGALALKIWREFAAAHSDQDFFRAAPAERERVLGPYSPGLRSKIDEAIKRLSS